MRNVPEGSVNVKRVVGTRYINEVHVMRGRGCDGGEEVEERPLKISVMKEHRDMWKDYKNNSREPRDVNYANGGVYARNKKAFMQKVKSREELDRERSVELHSARAGATGGKVGVFRQANLDLFAKVENARDPIQRNLRLHKENE